MTENTITLTTDDATAKALVATIRAAVNGDNKYLDYATAHDVTRENVADHARALAVLAYPSDAPVQKKDGKRTRFGNAVSKAAMGLRRTFEAEESSEDDTTDYLAKIIAAVDNGVTHNLNASDILAAVRSHVDNLLS